MDKSQVIYDFLRYCHHIDKDITLAVNSVHCGWSDSVWMLFSNKEIWFVMYLTVLVFLFRNLGWKRAIIGLLSIVLTIVCCDQLGNLSKDFFERLRPCWDADMMAGGLHVLEGMGNKYGFYSAHAANAMGFAVTSAMVFRNDRSRRYNIYTVCVVVWAFLVGFSRIFVGKHFFGDVMTGFAVGAVIGYLFGKLSSVNVSRITARFSFILHGHILNPIWLPRAVRRARREKAQGDMSVWYFSKEYLSSTAELPDEGNVTVDDSAERIYSLWLQGEENAPDLVKSCFASVRKNCTQELVVLDESSVISMTQMPEVIVRKYRKGIIDPAHFADICRLELLYHYGGYWIDATCLVTAPIPEYITDCDFFVFMAGKRIECSYSFIQNCFIRARKGDWLLGAWRKMVLDYWSRENGHIDYFQHQLMFKTIVENTDKGAEHFSRMPKIDQYDTHRINIKGYTAMFDPQEFEDIKSGAFFQKMSRHLKTYPEGSYIDVIAKGEIN